MARRSQGRSSRAAERKVDTRRLNSGSVRAIPIGNESSCPPAAGLEPPLERRAGYRSPHLGGENLRREVPFSTKQRPKWIDSDQGGTALTAHWDADDKGYRRLVAAVDTHRLERPVHLVISKYTARAGKHCLIASDTEATQTLARPWRLKRDCALLYWVY